MIVSKRYKTVLALVAVVAFMLLLPAGCVDQPDYGKKPDDPYANFDLLAKTVGERYCFFAEKDIDWNALCSEARRKIKPDTHPYDLFFIMSDLLDNLKDGHVNLVSPFNTSYYKAWWTDYPQDFNMRTLEEYYLDFGGLQTSGMRYVMFVPDSIGYIYYPSFNYEVGAGNLDYVLAILSKSKGLVIDIRDNGGGLLSNVPTLVSRFIDHKVTGGYIRHKTGPGANDFSKQFRYEYSPCGSSQVSYGTERPVAVLTNRSCFSAANDFVAVMKSLPQVEIIGARTGGGGGLPFSSELPNGWGIRFSACPMYAPDGSITEMGIDPSEGCEVHCTPEELAAGKDAILDFALARIASKTKIDN
ncbi:MAG: S41 family peptidase [Muribaculaceae bacterium]|nr:S41 family peptidase [Muribaculaceae bacterium]